MYTYWRKATSGKRNRYKLKLQLADIERQTGDQVFFGNRYGHPQSQLRRATIHYYKCQQTAIEMRESHLHTRQDILIGDNPKARSKAIQNMRTMEQKIRMYKTIRAIHKPHLTNGGLSYILIPKDDGTLERIDDVHLMNDALFERNRNHFAQADGTPCTRDPLINIIGTNGISESAQDILKGTLPPDLPTPIQLLFEAIQDHVPALDDKYDLETMIAGFAGWRECPDD